jgi:hypothetical protein
MWHYWGVALWPSQRAAAHAAGDRGNACTLRILPGEISPFNGTAMTRYGETVMGLR